jgi:hypothetical protein
MHLNYEKYACIHAFNGKKGVPPTFATTPLPSALPEDSITF